MACQAPRCQARSPKALHLPTPVGHGEARWHASQPHFSFLNLLSVLNCLGQLRADRHVDFLGRRWPGGAPKIGPSSVPAIPDAWSESSPHPRSHPKAAGRMFAAESYIERALF